ncbi:response regulator receiver domain protein [Jejuia pallidilutea]|uniref:Response regulator receiver domain protein n=2 Tax=Jejuia pallidilutea TaxID=504487 RepID=A0A090W8N2_9FLAO|nr:response regulator receiver domain protein [Jejuia pallidilutea]
MAQRLFLQYLLSKLEAGKMEKKILIVDDEPNIVMSLEYTFKKQNFEVFIARDGGEALEILKHQTPSVVLLDIMMPNVDGYQTLKHIKNTNSLKNTKVVFLTAKNKASDIEKGLKLGADKYLTKPFSVKKIVSEILELIA